MRPPLNAGENHRVDPVRRGGVVPSMRPPLNAGENKLDADDVNRRIATFNEAPAERGGKPRRWSRRRGSRSPFNEAPAERGGKLGVPDADFDLALILQ